MRESPQALNRSFLGAGSSLGPASAAVPQSSTGDGEGAGEMVPDGEGMAAGVSDLKIDHVTRVNVILQAEKNVDSAATI